MSRGRPRKQEEVWWQKAAELMVRHSIGLRRAAETCGVLLDETQANNLSRTTHFQKLLWMERNRYYRELAEDPDRSKITAIGLALLAIQKLADSGSWDKVVESVLKLGRIEGWVGAEGNVNIFQNISAEDLAEARKQLQTHYKETGFVQ